MLAIFGFRKKRNSALSNQEPEPGGDAYGEECRTVATAPTGTATENVYTLLQPPRSTARAGSPGEGADGNVEEQQVETPQVLSPPPVQGIPYPGMGGSKHPFYSPKESSEPDAEPEQPVETDRHRADDKPPDRQRTEGQHTERHRMEGRQADRHVDRQSNQQWSDDRPSERTWAETKTADRQTDRYWTESRHPERHMEKQWTVDRHTQRQIDRKMERQWTMGRQIDRSWAENRPTDIQIDRQWVESRHPGRQADRQFQAQHLAQRPLPPYPSDSTPSPKQETDPQKTMEAITTDRQACQQDTSTDRHTCSDPVGGHTEGWRGGRAVPCGSKPDPPPQSSKPNLSRLRQRPLQENSVAEEEGDAERDPVKIEKKEREKGRESEGQPPPIPEKPKTSSYVTFPKESANERNLPPPPVPPPVTKPMLGLSDRAASQGDEGIRPQVPVKPQRNRKAMSCDTDAINSAPGHSELL